MKHINVLSRIFFTGCLFGAGCATTPSSRLYRLDARSETVEAQGEVVSRIIRLNSVTLPGVLHQPTVITETSPVQIHSSEYDRWAESLERQVAEVLSRNLTALLPNAHVVRGRMHPDLKADLEVHVEVLQLSGTLGDQARLDLRWSQSRRGEASAALHRWQGQRTLESMDVHAYVLAQSELLAEACQIMAKHLLSP
ncbi:MAG: membrane integrity-associated transporter subunit PqiC [Verrucomicrobia bacterium]|nr:membrane integrity-associated transporter subunit PqiC [Verrucomicrobiota bacterium]MCH8512034.1 PqiC family protein [Kiritimatiellia bacterium]